MLKASELLQLPCRSLTGVSEKIGDRLKKLGLETVFDLLFHLPLRYEDRTQILPIASLKPGQSALIQGTIEAANLLFRPKARLMCRVRDPSGYCFLTFFYFNASQKNSLIEGKSIRAFGDTRLGRNGLEMIHPEYRLLDKIEALPIESHLTPVYPTTEKLTQNQLRKIITQALTMLDKIETLPELIPQELLARSPSLDFPPLKHALAYLHHPPPGASLEELTQGKHPYQTRLIFEELLAHHLSLCQIKQKNKMHRAHAMPRISNDAPTAERGVPAEQEGPKAQKDLRQQFLAGLPFVLTQAQKRVIQEIEQDLENSFPMMRLVQGDVGCGKTLVAALAALRAIKHGYQVALMAPTELLAEQHASNFKRWLAPLNINSLLLKSKLTAKNKRGVEEAISDGSAQLIIGTHALFQESIRFKKLALIIIDEQHRFGVHQRLLLHQKGVNEKTHPHQLIMTATPIPRTLAMSFYGDLDHSIIDELPKNRGKIQTLIINSERRDSVISRVREACLSKNQVYWVCPLIEASEELECEAAEKMHEQLSTLLPELNISLIHGRMKSAEKEKTMHAFQQGITDILVATTVIEVGVDIPNANLMIIENAERLGLTQLHQLRGRIGRGIKNSFCLLLYQTPLSLKAKQRLEIMRSTLDGFVIAEKDLELRGAGEMLGTRQTGDLSFRIANLARDQALFSRIQQAGHLITSHYPQLIPALIQRWIKSNFQYAKV